MNLSVYEMIEQVANENSRPKKVALLRQYGNENKSVKIILDLCFNPVVEWLLPEGNPPYKPQPVEADVQNVLKADARRLQYFVNTAEGRSLPIVKREQMFIQFLEAVDHQDARLLLSIKDRKMPFKNFTKKLVEEAFPNETKGWSPEGN